MQGQASNSGDDDDDYTPIVIGICVVAVIIVAITAFSLMVCFCNRPVGKEGPRYEAEEGQFGFAKSWSAGYMQFGSNAYGGQNGGIQNGNGYPSNTGHTNNTYATTLSNGTTYPSNSYGYTIR